MFFTPEVPVAADATPGALVVAVERAVAVEVHTDAPVAAPAPLCPAVQAMVVMVATLEVPARTDAHPLGSSPPLVDLESVEVTTNAAEMSPEPTWALVVVVAAPQVPV